MNAVKVIKIENIVQRIEFAISLLDWLYLHHDKIKINIYCKLYNQDKKIINKLNKSSLINRLLFNKYSFNFDKPQFDNTKSISYKYFAYDWNYFINKHHSATFNYSKNEFLIFCFNEKKSQLERLLYDFVHKQIITDFDDIII